MSLFHKKQTPVEEFLHVYTRVHQLCNWSQGQMPVAFHRGAPAMEAQQSLVDWARENNGVIDYLNQVRHKAVSGQVGKKELREATSRAQALLDNLDTRLATLGQRK